MKNLLHIHFDSRRIFGLDILRALAILFVVGRHSSYLLPKPLYEFVNFFIFDGVSIFFVLSGYLIGAILIRQFENQEVNKKLLSGFWKRRWFRTLPNYFLILIILCLLHFLFTENFPFKSIVPYFLFSQNLFYDHPLWFFPEAWSLSIEEWFYLLTPLLLYLLIKFFKLTTRHAIIVTVAFVILLVTVSRYIRYESLSIQTIDEWDLIFRKQVISRLDSLMFGILGAYFSFYHPAKWIKHKTILLITGIALLLFSKFVADRNFPELGLYNCVFSFTTISLATLFLLPFLTDIKTGKGFFYTTITRISLISYSMYLVNLSLVKNWIIDKINWIGIFNNNYLLVFFKYSIFWSLTILLSILLYKYFELPMMNMRDKEKQKA